ncbi:MAG: hypothetical protein WBM04_00575 [Candidatus Korobacteraceae bacterium]
MGNDTNSRLKNLIRKKGKLPIQGLPQVEAGFTVLAVEPPEKPQEDIERAIQLSTFTVLLDDGLLVDVDGHGAKGTLVVGGHRISSLNNGMY